MSLVLTDSQKVDLSIAPKDAAGNPAKVDGAPAWASSDPSLLTVTASADGLSAVATTVGPLGTAQVRVSADADLGAGVVPLAATLDVEIVGGQATSLSIAPSVPTER